MNQIPYHSICNVDNKVLDTKSLYTQRNDPDYIRYRDHIVTKYNWLLQFQDFLTSHITPEFKGNLWLQFLDGNVELGKARAFVDLEALEVTSFIHTSTHIETSNLIGNGDSWVIRYSSRQFALPGSRIFVLANKLGQARCLYSPGFGYTLLPDNIPEDIKEGDRDWCICLIDFLTTYIPDLRQLKTTTSL